MEYWFVASGGGSKGAPYHAGVLKRRAEQGVEYVGGAGSSAGGLAAAAVVQHHTLVEAAAYIEELALTVETSDIHKRKFPFGVLHGLFNGSGSFRTAKPFVEYMKGVMDPAKIASTGKKLRLGVTALTDPPGSQDHTDEAAPGAVPFFVIDETFDPLWAAGYATSAFPGVFEPQLINGRWCIDGGIQVVTPISAAIAAGATHIDAVVAETPWPSYKPTKEKMPSGVDVLLRSLELAIHRLTWVDIKYTQLINELVSSGHPGHSNKRYVHLNVIHPDSSLNDDSMDFKPEEAAQILLRGYEKAGEVPPFTE